MWLWRMGRSLVGRSTAATLDGLIANEREDLPLPTVRQKEKVILSFTWA